MLNSPVLNVVIGLVFIFLLYSLLATIVKEIIASGLNLRANMLAKAIKRMLDDDSKKKPVQKAINGAASNDPPQPAQSLSSAFYNNPGIKYMADGKKRSKPSYLEPTVFSKALSEVLKGDAQGVNTVTEIKSRIESGAIYIEDETKKYILSLIADSHNDIDKLKAMLEDWFNNMMDRASGWYKRQAQLILLVIGLVVAVIFNVDTLGIIGKL